MKRTPMPPRTKELERGGFEKIRKPHPANARSKGLPRRNRKRRAKRQAEAFGDHAEFIRTLPCVVRGWDDGFCDRVAACHAKSRGAGGTAKDLVPMCDRHHGMQHQIGVRTFEDRHGVDLTAIAAELWASSPYNTDESEDADV